MKTFLFQTKKKKRKKGAHRRIHTLTPDFDIRDRKIEKEYDSKGSVLFFSKLAPNHPF